MKLPPALHPLRGTRFAWLVPFTWALLKCAAATAPTTVEVFLHHRFGARSGRALLKGFILLLTVCLISRRANVAVAFPLFPGYLCAYSLVALGHWLTSQSQQGELVHSHSNGQPWPLWQQIPVNATTVLQCYEPAICCLIAFVVLFSDPSMAHWLFFSAAALFVKVLLRRVRERTRRLDALDHRAETERIVPRPRQEAEPFVEARQAPPVNRHGR